MSRHSWHALAKTATNLYSANENTCIHLARRREDPRPVKTHPPKNTDSSRITALLHSKSCISTLFTRRCLRQCSIGRSERGKDTRPIFRLVGDVVALSLHIPSGLSEVAQQLDQVVHQWRHAFPIRGCGEVATQCLQHHIHHSLRIGEWNWIHPRPTGSD